MRRSAAGLMRRGLTSQPGNFPLGSSMRLKVCQVIPTLDQGGAEKQMALLAGHMDRARFEPHVVVLTRSGPLESELKERGVHVHFVEKKGKLDPTALLRLTKKLREIAPDIVHTWLFAANSYGRVAARRANVPVLIAAERCVDPWKRWWHHAIDKRLLKSTDAIATNTTAISDFYNRHGIPKELFEVIPNAILPATKSELGKEELFQQLGIEPRRFVVGAIGRLWEQKGYKDLIWAAELLRVATEDVWLVIFGDGPDRDKLLKFRDQIGAHRSVRMMGHRENAAEYIAAFDLLWNGSLYEGQSNTILEAMMQGVPVVASDIPGNRDLVVPGETGQLFPLGNVDELTRHSYRLLHDDEKREGMGIRAREFVEQEFSLEKMLRSYAELYERLWESKKPG